MGIRGSGGPSDQGSRDRDFPSSITVSKLTEKCEGHLRVILFSLGSWGLLGKNNPCGDEMRGGSVGRIVGSILAAGPHGNQA